MKHLSWLAALLTVAAGEGKVIEQVVEYPAGEVTCRGYLARDDSFDGPRPGVLVIHEWYGLNDYAKLRARQLAELGYVGFAADMYGEGRVGATREEAAALAGSVRGTPLMRTRGQAALAALAAQPGVDPRRLAAIGFCFGGTGALELAYTGADLRGVVSFHGGLTVPSAEDIPRLKARVLICHGADDRSVQPETITACLEGLTKAGIDWQFNSYAGAVHAFTNPSAGTDPTRGAAYHESAARRSWQAMREFLAESLAE